MATRRLSKEELSERNEKILRMAEMGCSYRDIGGRYGLATQSIYAIVGDNDKTRGVKARFGASNDIGRACFCGGEN